MSGARDVVSWAWYGEGSGAALVRTMLRPAAGVFGAIVRRRNARFDASKAAMLAQARGDALPPAMSIGNLSVGGTGKTPVSSWFAARLVARGARPALVLRGYGDDEWRVHQLLTPSVPVLISPDRRAALAEARAQGADCCVLDDAFQHRRAPRVSDVVLVSADRWSGTVSLLPAGPFREPLHSLRRATAAIVTVKAAAAARTDAVVAAISAAAPALPVAVVRLEPAGLHPVGDAGTASMQPMSALDGRRVLALSAIADPDAFVRQLRGHGAVVTDEARFPDHHGYTEADIGRVSRVLHRADLVVCTLKDAVKLAPLWPRIATPLWYVSQTLVVDRGAEVLERECDRVLAAR